MISAGIESVILGEICGSLVTPIGVGRSLRCGLSLPAIANPAPSE